MIVLLKWKCIDKIIVTCMSHILKTKYLLAFLGILRFWGVSKAFLFFIEIGCIFFKVTIYLLNFILSLDERKVVYKLQMWKTGNFCLQNILSFLTKVI